MTDGRKKKKKLENHFSKVHENRKRKQHMDELNIEAGWVGSFALSHPNIREQTSGEEEKERETASTFEED